MMRGWSLALRLAVLLSGVLVVVLLLAGFVVNRGATRSLDEALGPRQQERLDLAGQLVEEALRRGARPRAFEEVARRVAASIDGTVRIVDGAGRVLADAGRLPSGVETERHSTDLAADVGGGSLDIEIRSPAAGFLRAFNATLLWTGIVAVLALLGAAALASSRMTRPLRDVAQAARRLEAGDLAARATGGVDAESAELAEAFNAMAARLERSEGLRQRAASDVAHDLATPATVLESQIQAMVDGVVPADAAGLEQARVAAATLSALIGQLGELTQAEAATLQRQPGRVELRALVTSITDSLAGLLRERAVTAEVTGEDGTVLADPGQLTRAIRNVVTNAIQHAPAGTTVTIETRHGLVRVIDRGPGIPEADLPFVFERFYRTDPSRGEKPGGSGIGLTVARELITANGGRIEVERTGPDGTTFRIELPPA